MTPRKFIELISPYLGIDAATGVNIDRALVRAGLRSVSGRGRAAYNLNSPEMARLLVALSVSQQPSDAVRIAGMFDGAISYLSDVLSLKVNPARLSADFCATDGKARVCGVEFISSTPENILVGRRVIIEIDGSIITRSRNALIEGENKKAISKTKKSTQAHRIEYYADCGPWGRTKLFEFVSRGLLPARKIDGTTFVLEEDWNRFLEGAPLAVDARATSA